MRESEIGVSALENMKKVFFALARAPYRNGKIRVKRERTMRESAIA